MIVMNLENLQAQNDGDFYNGLFYNVVKMYLTEIEMLILFLFLTVFFFFKIILTIKNNNFYYIGGHIK